MRHIAAAVALACLTACAQKMGTVIPEPDGLYRVEATGYTREEALKTGVYTAGQTCKERGMRHVVIDQRWTYAGLVSEQTNKALNTASSVITATTGVWAGTMSGADDHRLSLAFRCEQ